MKIKEYFTSWIGKRSDYDQNKSYQCVDWARQYCADAGVPIGTFSGSAINGWKTGSPFSEKFWTRVENTPDAIPTPGDIVFFKGGEYGHVAVVAEGSTKMTLCIVEQNGGVGLGTGIGSDAIRYRTVPFYRNCVGWYTLKK